MQAECRSPRRRDTLQTEWVMDPGMLSVLRRSRDHDDGEFLLYLIVSSLFVRVIVSVHVKLYARYHKDLLSPL